MKYQLSSLLEINYSPLLKYVAEGEEVSKNELVGRCSGNVPFELLQSVKELEFDWITQDGGELYIY